MTETAKKLEERAFPARKAWNWTDPEAPNPDYCYLYNPYKSGANCLEGLVQCRKFLAIIRNIDPEGYAADDELMEGVQFLLDHVRDTLEHIGKAIRSH